MPTINSENATYSLPDQFHSGLTMRGLFELWLSSLQHTVSPSSYRTYERIVLRHILPTLGESEIDYLTRTDINEFLKDKLNCGRLDGRGGLSRKTVDDISRVLCSALKLVNWDYSFVSSEHTFVKSQHDKRDIETLTDAQARLLIQYLANNLDRSNAGFIICLFTGIKLSEICALKDADFELNVNCLHVRRTLQRVTMQEELTDQSGNQDTVDYDPTDSGYRDLILPDELSTLLRSIMRSAEPGAYFLSGAADAPLGPRTYQYRFQSVLSGCGLPLTINFHVLRHSFALLLILRCHNLEELRRALGHASVKVTQNHYSKLLKHEKLYLQDYVRLLISYYPEIWIH